MLIERTDTQLVLSVLISRLLPVATPISTLVLAVSERLNHAYVAPVAARIATKSIAVAAKSDLFFIFRSS